MVIVGAGIVGAAVAFEVARAGAEVVLLDKSVPACGVTADSFAWIGGPRGADVLHHKITPGFLPLADRVYATGLS
ncbi:FAD-dependent oxidoreductase [Micromonospora sp. LOL_015]|uniref:FAD-dependent oxidoreductase n=1 Tax=Micromonospora sp. LOL_015 TaxID=3345416 RepID=UPI003A866434